MNTTKIKQRHSIKQQVESQKQHWYEYVYKPTHYLVIQLPEHQKTKDEFKSLSHLRMIMKVFEKSLFGRHWNKKHLPFIAFAENNTSPEWHYNVLFNNGKFSDRDLQIALNKTSRTLYLPSYSLCLEPIKNNLDIVMAYCDKEMNVDWRGWFNSSRMILSHDLFYLPYQSNLSRTHIKK